jgi:hypothetical protein
VVGRLALRTGSPPISFLPEKLMSQTFDAHEPNRFAIKPGSARRSEQARPSATSDSNPFRFDDESDGEVIRRPPNWLDVQFRGESIWGLAFFAFIFGTLAFPCALIGVIGCKDQRARTNALLLLGISMPSLLLSLVYAYTNVLAVFLR